jgi:twitching motility protein PilT
MAELLSEAVEKEASDVHITVGVPPVFRIDGELVESSFTRLTPKDTKALVYSFLNEHQVYSFRTNLELCCSIAFTGGRRFRMSAFHQRGAVAACLRLIPKDVPSRESLHLPESMMTAVQNTFGLVLVTGSSGCGKSTTLNYMIDFLNHEKELHIITIESPIEHLHKHDKCMVNQREIGKDTIDNAHALRAALREDVDIMVIAELGIDSEMVDQVLEAADTGHLVISTFHTTDAASTIQGLSELFPLYTDQTRVRLGRLIRAIFCQQLLRSMKGGLVPAVEVLLGSIAVKGAIESGQHHKIYNAMQMGRNMGMQTMEQSLMELVKEGHIDRETALSSTIHHKEITRMLDDAGY